MNITKEELLTTLTSTRDGSCNHATFYRIWQSKTLLKAQHSNTIFYQKNYFCRLSTNKKYEFSYCFIANKPGPIADADLYL
jgi:hypothetical protein